MDDTRSHVKALNCCSSLPKMAVSAITSSVVQGRVRKVMDLRSSSRGPMAFKVYCVQA